MEKKLKDYLLEESGGVNFPSGKCPNVAEYAKEALGSIGATFWPMQRLIIKVVINTSGLFPKVELTEWEQEKLKELQENALNPVGERKYAQAVVRRTPNSKQPMVILLICGRGSGKTFMSGFLLSYFVRWLMSLKNAHQFFGLAKVKPIALQCLAGKESQAVSLFRVFKSNIARVAAFRNTYTELKESISFGNAIEARAYTSNANTVRGEDTFCYYHEETAFCAEDTPDSEKSFTQCFKAIGPAVKNRFGQWGFFLFVTSAGMKKGKTFDLYNKIKNGTIENCVMFQLAIWNINPNFKKEDFAQEYAIDSVDADAEQGSQFVDAMNTFLTEAEVYSMIKPDQKRKEKGDGKTQYWMRIDPSRKHDRYAIAVGHKEKRVDEKGREQIVAVVDHVHYWEAFWEDADGNKCRPKRPADKARMKFVGVSTQEILAYMYDLCERFDIVGVTSDQFESQYIIEELNEAFGTAEFPFGFINAITEKSNWLAYRNMKKLIYQGCLEIYPEQAFIDEALVAMRYNKNKPLQHQDVYLEANDEGAEIPDKDPNMIYSVQAPRSGPTTTDDVMDVVAFLAFDMMSNMDLSPIKMQGVGSKGIRDSAKKEVVKTNPVSSGDGAVSYIDTIPESW